MTYTSLGHAKRKISGNIQYRRLSFPIVTRDRVAEIHGYLYRTPPAFLYRRAGHDGGIARVADPLELLES